MDVYQCCYETGIFVIIDGLFFFCLYGIYCFVLIYNFTCVHWTINNILLTVIHFLIPFYSNTDFQRYVQSIVVLCVEIMKRIKIIFSKKKFYRQYFLFEACTSGAIYSKCKIIAWTFNPKKIRTYYDQYAYLCF